MKVTEKDVDYVATLANLELSAGERSSMLRDLNSILGYIDNLNELDTGSVEPMAQVVASAENQENGQSEGYTLREDKAEGLRQSFKTEAALANAPSTDGTYFLVPKVLER